MWQEEDEEDKEGEEGRHGLAAKHCSGPTVCEL